MLIVIMIVSPMDQRLDDKVMPIETIDVHEMVHDFLDKLVEVLEQVNSFLENVDIGDHLVLT